MNVTRIHTEYGSRPEPALNPRWSALAKLQWAASLAAHDCGIPIRVEPSDFRAGRRRIRGHYDVEVGDGGLGSSAAGPMTYRDAWSYIQGAGAGARAAGSRP